MKSIFKLLEEEEIRASSTQIYVHAKNNEECREALRHPWINLILDENILFERSIGGAYWIYFNTPNDVYQHDIEFRVLMNFLQRENMPHGIQLLAYEYAYNQALKLCTNVFSNTER